MKRFFLVVTLLVAAVANAGPDGDPKIQIAILLDTSGSMDGLINQTREQLWKIVNSFATAKRDGRQARLELALYHYGNAKLRSSNHYVEQLSGLTTNLDKVSEQLFALRTTGGEEWCGAVIQHAMKELEWSRAPGDLKLIYIAGNEPFDQGPIAFREVVKTAIAQGIVVNTIHAGDAATGVNQHWAEAAKLADGTYLTIDQNRAVARIDAPQDAELANLNQQLNGTYVGYGKEGAVAVQRQAAQDSAARGMSASSAATRVISKGSQAYKNSEWDLVDATADGKKASEIPVEALPAPLKAMDPAERDQFVEQKAKERAEIQAKIGKLAKDREAYVASELKKKAEAGPASMDEALIQSARAKAAAKKFSF